MSATGRKPTRWPLLLAAAVIFFVNLVPFRWSVPYLRSLAGGEEILDTHKFGYSAADVDSYFKRLGPFGKDEYRCEIWTVDLVLPALLGWALWSATRNRLVWIATACDYAENVAITLLLGGAPVAALASALTVGKWLAYTAAFVAVALRWHSDASKDSG